ncbi:hypothetical protein [Angustibacter sp. Root456]|uniref:DUF6912 family protein n=1 Tax=Angustibacter sp. Root456 TaxID=1736539 RepID=UPI0006F29135|nr:hypothetical protein [Angustibacter sp. Root456]KQX69860.1 hypothetical protein ASD06_02295 [Angustibacter sp. Root456]
MRVYVPTTVELLQTLRDKGFQPPVAAHAVTPAVREWYVEGDLEELEYAASDEAAEASLRLLAATGNAVPRRVVVAADVPDDAVRPSGLARSGIEVQVPVTLADVASVHVDDDEARADVRVAAQAVCAADAGDDGAAADVGQAAAHELLWYDVSELDDVLGLA